MFQTEGATLRALHTPGHCDDHICLYLDEEKALFSGDSVLGCGSTVFENLKAYMESLQTTLATYPDTKTIYPGHGPHLLDQGIAPIQKNLNHRLDRENQILALLSVDLLSPKDIVSKIYAGYDPSVIPAAMYR